MTRRKIEVHIRWMVRKDTLRVLEIDRQSFETPMIESELLKLLRQRETIGMVAEDDAERVVGFMVYSLLRHSLEVNRMVVDPDCRLRSVGAQMIDKLVSKLHYQRRNSIAMMVEETNLGGLRFLKKLGFVATGLVRSPYEQNDRDGISMRFIQMAEVTA